MSEAAGYRGKLPEQWLAALRPLGRQFPTIDSAVAQMARLSAELTLPKGTIHVISDVHGEYAKLRHVINNVSGTLRRLVEQLFGDRLAPAELEEFLRLVFYPRETLDRLVPLFQDPGHERQYFGQTLGNLFEIFRVLAGRHSFSRAVAAFPEQYRMLFGELLYGPAPDQRPEYVAAIVQELVGQRRTAQLVRLTVRVLRNLAIDELVIAGDCWDRGPRGDLVMDNLLRRSNVSFTWGNHDVSWIGASLGLEALIANVLRISLRYRRLSQLEEGYGITLQPLERLVRTVYADDPAECYRPSGSGLREPITMARMQKAAAVMQFKLEGQVIQRNPQFEMEHRCLLHRINQASDTIEIDGASRRLRDSYFPTIDPTNPYQLSPEEQACIDRIRQSFLSSRLRAHVRFLVERGAMVLRRDDHLIFHGCVPVDEQGDFLPMVVDGQPRRGRALFEAIEQVVVRVLDQPSTQDLDLLWYLWCGPRSPLFGKDRITTLENDLVADPETHLEQKNPYFRLIHEAEFCTRVLSEFGADPERGIIVNGHVPVRIEQGESPLKRSGKAITIDGAFSEAYGDHGFTLVLEPDRTFLAKHHHFESVEAAVRDGVDIIPTISVVRQWDRPRRVADTERGEEIRSEIELLERLVAAYRANQLRQG